MAKKQPPKTLWVTIASDGHPDSIAVFPTKKEADDWVEEMAWTKEGYCRPFKFVRQG